MHAYTWSCKTLFTEETWLGLIVQLRCISPAPDPISEDCDRRSPKSEIGSLELLRRWIKEPSSILIRDRGRLQGLILLTCISTTSLSQTLFWDSINYEKQRRRISSLSDKGNRLEKQTPRFELRRWLTNLGSYLQSQNKWFRPEYKCACNLLPWFN